RTVLRTNVIALPIELCRVMDSEEHLQQLFVTHFAVIKHDLDRFGMTGRPGTHLLICRIRCVPTYISLCHAFHTFQKHEGPFHTPNASTGKYCLIFFHCHFLCFHLIAPLPM